MLINEVFKEKTLTFFVSNNETVSFVNECLLAQKEGLGHKTIKYGS